MKALLFIGLTLSLPCWGAQLLSAYLGTGQLAPGSWVNPFCGVVDGLSAMPVTFSERVLDFDPTGAVDPSLFQVETNQGVVIPRCATLQPAFHPSKNLTVLLVGSFANAPGRTPQRVRVVDDLALEDGTSGRGLSVAVTLPTAFRGARLLDARGEAPSADSGSECPAPSNWFVRLVFQGGQTGVFNSPLGSRQGAGTRVWSLGVDGTRRSVPILALGDDGDLDNFVGLCLQVPAEQRAGLQVSVEYATYFDPVNRPNLPGNVPVR